MHDQVDSTHEAGGWQAPGTRVGATSPPCEKSIRRQHPRRGRGGAVCLGSGPLHLVPRLPCHPPPKPALPVTCPSTHHRDPARPLPCRPPHQHSCCRIARRTGRRGQGAGSRCCHGLGAGLAGCACPGLALGASGRGSRPSCCLHAVRRLFDCRGSWPCQRRRADEVLGQPGRQRAGVPVARHKELPPADPARARHPAALAAAREVHHQALHLQDWCSLTGQVFAPELRGRPLVSAPALPHFKLPGSTHLPAWCRGHTPLRATRRHAASHLPRRQSAGVAEPRGGRWVLRIAVPPGSQWRRRRRRQFKISRRSKPAHLEFLQRCDDHCLRRPQAVAEPSCKFLGVWFASAIHKIHE